MTDENEVVTAAVNEKGCPEFNSDRHSKEVKIILSVNVLITGFPKWVIYYFRLRKGKNMLSELYDHRNNCYITISRFFKAYFIFKCYLLKLWFLKKFSY